MRQANVEHDAPGRFLPVLFREPFEKSHQPIGYGQVCDVFGGRECLVPLLVKVFGDVHREAGETRHQSVHVLGSRHAQQRIRHGDRDRRSLDCREHDFFAEQAAVAEKCHGDVLTVGRTSRDTDRPALDEIDETRFVALLKENVAFLTGLLDEQLLAIRDRFVAGAIEKTRLFQIPNLIFGCAFFGESRAAR